MLFIPKSYVFLWELDLNPPCIPNPIFVFIQCACQIQLKAVDTIGNYSK